MNLTEEKDEKAAELDKFVQGFELLEDFIFGDAQYELNKRRQINKPEKLPDEGDIRLVRDKIITTMRDICADPFHIWDKNTYVRIRDSACTRLTLLNARRGGEPGRVTIAEWREALNDKWIDKQRSEDFDDLDQVLIKSLKVTYLTGKGNNHLVPLLIPGDTTEALQKLSNQEARNQAGVCEMNEYLFASIHQSEDHVSGWHAMHRVCNTLPLNDPKNMKSPSNRHRISTLFAALDLTKADREHFYRHMGHSEAINQQVYQAPMALMEVTKIGKQLLAIDEGRDFLITNKIFNGLISVYINFYKSVMNCKTIFTQIIYKKALIVNITLCESQKLNGLSFSRIIGKKKNIFISTPIRDK